MTNEEFAEAVALLDQAIGLSKPEIERELHRYGAGVNGWGDLFDYEKLRIIRRVLSDRFVKEVRDE